MKKGGGGERIFFGKGRKENEGLGEANRLPLHREGGKKGGLSSREKGLFTNFTGKKLIRKRKKGQIKDVASREGTNISPYTSPGKEGGA